jgi:hypothetical protein
VADEEPSEGKPTEESGGASAEALKEGSKGSVELIEGMSHYIKKIKRSAKRAWLEECTN